MSHLIVELYERFGDRFPCCTLDDHEVSNRQYFHDLQQRGIADRAARVIVRPGDEYHIGDHVRLLDKVRRSYADTVVIDPVIANEVDLNEVLFDEQGFTERAEAVLIVPNPNIDSSYRLRVSLYAEVGQKIPSLVLYDWEYPLSECLADLNYFHFANKAAFIRVERGPAYQEGDRIVLRGAPTTDARSYALEPGDYDLTHFMIEERRDVSRPVVRARKCWAETLIAIGLELQPRVIWN
jgi:hypothetical protein